MNRIKKKILLIAAPLFVLAAFVAAQPAIELNFQGILTDGEGHEISQEQFDFNVKLITAEPGRTELWSHASSTQTNESGWFSFSVPDISQYLMKDGCLTEPVVIHMEFVPNANTRWMRQGEDFMVSYTLTPTLKDECHSPENVKDGGI